MSLLDDIKKSTDFEILGDGTVKGFTKRPTVRTPLKVLDTLIGGGVPLGAIIDLFGPKGSGKSSYGYEMLGAFQKQYPEGLGVLIDSEASVDSLRMRALGVNPDTLLVLRGATMESGYKQILSILYQVQQQKPKNRVPIFILWDSLSATTTEAQYNRENVNGGGLAEAARINKEYLKQINKYLGDVDAMVVFINQVSSKIGMFTGSGWNESGGNALQHAVHYKIEFSANKPNFENGIAVSTNGGAKIVKNKLGPTTQEYPMVIDNTKGGVIDVVTSFLNYIWIYCFEKTGRGRYYFLPQMYKDYPRLHQFLTHKYPKLLGTPIWGDIVSAVQEDYEQGGIFLDFFTLKWADYISSIYTLQKDVIAPYREELMKAIEDYRISQGWEEDYCVPELEESHDEDDDSEE